jgi:hypothetical protein
MASCGVLTAPHLSGAYAHAALIGAGGDVPFRQRLCGGDAGSAGGDMCRDCDGLVTLREDNNATVVAYAHCLAAADGATGRMGSDDKMSMAETIIACGGQTWRDKLIARFTPSAIVVGGVREMVERVLVKTGPHGSIHELGILDHGGVPANSSNWLQLGSDMLYESEIATGGTEAWQSLANLKGFFADDGYLFLMNCGAGQSPAILRWAAQLVGARTYGGTGYEHGAGFNDGYYVLAWPDGTVKERVARPRTTVASMILDNDPRTAPVVGRSIGERLRDLVH